MQLGYSFCPNDTFIFHALTHGLVPGAPPVREVLEDVETLNGWAVEGKLELTKVSYAAYFRVLPHYVALRSGGALGRGVGPLLVALPGRLVGDGGRVLTPGPMTTSHMLLAMARPDLTLISLRYDQIVPALLRGDAEGGVLIHESRFTFSEHGLEQRLDLGAWWEEDTGLPLPLGAILARRDLGRERILQLQDGVRRSLEMAWEDPRASRDYIRRHAHELSDEVVQRHIETFVNALSADVGEEGERAVRELFRRSGGVLPPGEDLFP